MKYYLIFTLLGLSFYSKSQNTGLYGSRTFIEINSTSNMPIFSWFMDDNDQYKPTGVGNNLMLSTDKINYGISGVIGRSGKKNVGVSLEFAYAFQNIAGPRYLPDFGEYTDQWGYISSYSIYMVHERLDVRTLTIMPKLEFTNKGGTLPVGLNHQIGIGYTVSTVKKKDYIYRLFDGSENLTDADSANFKNNIINYDQQYKGITLLYAFNIRTPLSKHLMINYGIRYTLNVRNLGQYIPSSSYYYDEDLIKRNIGRMRMLNFLTFNIGLSFAF